MALYGARRDEQALGDLGVGETLGGQPDDLALGWCEARPPGRRSLSPAAASSPSAVAIAARHARASASYWRYPHDLEISRASSAAARASSVRPRARRTSANQVSPNAT